MADPPDAEQIEQVAHLSLRIGRILLVNGADTTQVADNVARFAQAFGCEAHLLVSYEGLVLTIVGGEHFRTKIGNRVPAMNVGMTIVGSLNRLVDDVVGGRLSLSDIAAELTMIERRPAEYSRWLVIAALGLTAGSLSRLFGGDWPTFAVAWLAGSVGTWLRQELGRRHLNPLGVAFAAASIGGLIGGGAVLLGLSGTPSLCLVAPAMIIVPGVPLINGVEDLIRNHVTLGASRLTFAAMVIVAIGLGLFVATTLTGAAIPVEEAARVISVPEDAVFSALAALGYAFLFNVPARVAWACVVCGVASHSLRTLCVHLGVDIVAGTLLGALASGLLAQGFARYFAAPAATFAFAGVVAMVPGAYAFRALLGTLQVAHGNAAPGVASTTLTLAILVVLMVAAIAVGVAVPLLLFGPSNTRENATWPRARPTRNVP